MKISEDKTILDLLFRKAQKNNVRECLNFLKNVLTLSNSFRTALLEKDRVGKKFNKTDRIRNEIDKLVNKEGVIPQFINELIAIIRKGKIETIRTEIKDKKVEVTAITDFDQLLSKLLMPQLQE